MISWVIIAVLLIAGFILVRVNHFKHKIFLIFFIFLILFLYSTMVLVNNSNNLDLSTTLGFFSLVKVYFGWLGNGFANLKVITANAIKMDWTSTGNNVSIKEIDSKKI